MATNDPNDRRAYRRLVQEFCVLKSCFDGHSMAEDSIIIPYLMKRAEIPYTCHEEHHEEEDLFVSVEKSLMELDPFQMKRQSCSTDVQLLELKRLTQRMRISSLTHMWKEDNFLFPLIEQHCDIDYLRAQVLTHKDIQRALQLVNTSNTYSAPFYNSPRQVAVAVRDQSKTAGYSSFPVALVTDAQSPKRKRHDCDNAQDDDCDNAQDDGCVDEASSTSNGSWQTDSDDSEQKSICNFIDSDNDADPESLDKLLDDISSLVGSSDAEDGAFSTEALAKMFA
jgi:iron-sulfur cluster repair protein YtfE (RIC family)